MPLPAVPLLHAIFGGDIAGGEHWSIGYWWLQDAGTVNPTPAQMNTWADNLYSAFHDNVWNPAAGPLKVQNGPYCTLKTAKAMFYRGGVLVGQGLHTATPDAGTSPTGDHPPYVALVVSTLTDLPGRQHRGRIYQPITAALIDSATGEVSPTTWIDSNCANWALMLINGANLPPAQPGLAGAPVIVSQVGGSTTEITSVRVDNLADTQHGRSRALTPSHTALHSVP